MTSTFKTPRTAIQDYMKEIPTEKTLRVSRKRQPLSPSPRSNDGALARPGRSAAKVSRSSSVSELNEDTPRQLITGFVTTHSSTLPLTRHQSRIQGGPDMPPPSAKSKRNHRQSSLGIPQFDEIVKKFTPRTAIQGLLSQAPEKTPITGNIGDRKSQSYNSLPGVDSLLRDPSFEPLHKSFVGDFPSTGKQRLGTRQHRPIQLGLHHRVNDGVDSENETVQNLSARRSSRLHISADGNAFTKSPQSAGRRKSRGTNPDTSTSVLEQNTSTHSPNRHRPNQTDTQLNTATGRRRSPRNKTETDTSLTPGRQTQPSDTPIDNIDVESAAPASGRLTRGKALTPLLPSSRHISQVEVDVRSKTFHEFASQTSPDVITHTDAATSVSPTSRRSSFQIEIGRSNFGMDSTRGRRSSLTQPISSSVDQNASTQTATPTKSLSLHHRAMLKASHTTREAEDLSPSPVGRRSLQASGVSRVENIAPSGTDKRRSSLKQTVIDFSFTGSRGGSQAADTSYRLRSTPRQRVGQEHGSSVADDSRRSSRNLLTRRFQSFDSSLHAKDARLSSVLSVEDRSLRRQSSARKSSLGQTFNEDSMGRKSSPQRSRSLRQNNSEPDFVPESSLREINSEPDLVSQRSLREINSEPDFVPQSSLREINSEPDFVPQHSLREINSEPDFVPQRSLREINSEPDFVPQRSLREINSEPDFVPQRSLREINSEPDFVPQRSLREINSEPDFVPQSSSQRKNSLRRIIGEDEPIRESSPRRSSVLKEVNQNDEFMDNNDEIDGDEISSMVQSVIGQLASEDEAEMAIDGNDSEEEVADQEMMAAHEEDDEDVDEDSDVEMADRQTDNLQNKNLHIDHTEKEVTKTQKPRKPRKQPESHLPVSVVKGLFAHFSRARVTKEAIAEVVNISGKFWKSIAGDLESYAKHAQRKTIMDDDVTLLMRRQGFIKDKKSLNTLVHQYLPLELREQVIPIARSGNKIELGKKYLS